MLVICIARLKRLDQQGHIASNGNGNDQEYAIEVLAV